MTEPTPTPKPMPPMPGPQGFPSPPVLSGESGDPDAQGLPPDAKLPDAARYRRDQWFARLMVCLAGLLLLGWMTWVSQDLRTIYLVCTLAVAVATLFSAVHFLLAWRKAGPQQSDDPR